MKRAIWIVAAILLLSGVYVMSYAPALRLCRGYDYLPTPTLTPGAPVVIECYFYDARPLACYQPVIWLSSRTPAKEPLIRWARIWGVDGQFRSELWPE